MNRIRAAEINYRENRRSAAEFGMMKAEEAAAFHRSMPEYAPTPLTELTELARYLGVKRFFVKDESFRFGLNAFKGLGGSFAMHSLAVGRDGPLTFVTATDGNHGRGVAWSAGRLGHRAVVFMPKGTAPERLENIRKLGAQAEITDMSYDDTVRYAARQAAERGWILLQDTAWEGYEEIPMRIMQGYTTMGVEITEELGEVLPSHIFLQAGVGSMAGAMAAYFADVYGKKRPKVIVVEPEGANCIFRTAAADDGTLHFCGGDMQTIMAGLCCGEPCTVGWELLQKYADYALSCRDDVAADGMRILGNPLAGDPRIISGESGAVTSGAAAALMTEPELQNVREMLRLGRDSVILCISTEGDTDQDHYRRIVWNGACANPALADADYLCYAEK